jgi:REP element-mobilizing transposase RayT
MSLLTPVPVKEIVLQSLQFLQNERSIRLYSYVIMHDHLHLILQSDQIIKNMIRFKSYTARRIIDYYKSRKQTDILDALHQAKSPNRQDSDYQFWQGGYSPKQIQTMEIFQQKMDYIHLNPVRKGYVSRPEDWFYSSARNFAGLAAKISITRFSD